MLARYFLERYSREMHRRVKDLHPEGLARLQEYGWPGNVRELQNCIERAVILCDGDLLQPEHLHLRKRPAGGALTVEEIASQGGSLAAVASRAAGEAERIRIRHALSEAGGNKAQAAKLLQVSARTLSSRLKELGLEDEAAGEGAPAK